MWWGNETKDKKKKGMMYDEFTVLGTPKPRSSGYSHRPAHADWQAACSTGWFAGLRGEIQ
jgi:hypothetical protein